MSENELSDAVTRVLLELYQRHSIPMVSQPMAGVGENAYGQVLRRTDSLQFQKLVEFVKKDNLFTPEIEEVTIEFGKVQLRRARNILSESDGDQVAAVQEVLQLCEQQLKSLALYCVDGNAQAPHAVICHEFSEIRLLPELLRIFFVGSLLITIDVPQPNSDQPVEAKLIDFQMSRYAPPVLDIVHYLFACTEKELRDEHFPAFMDAYYNTLHLKLASCNLSLKDIYPRSVFNRQLQLFGVYGLIMGAFSLPFFISNANEVIDIDTVSEAIQNLSTSSDEPKYKELIEEYEMLNARTLPIFKRRITGIVEDLIKYNMTEPLFKMNSEQSDKVL
ncbi:uncharacterized protein LOC122618282 isoform X3 [Drosophila teissieri]|uniref:uncharacterized protein LOC122618282 isoform X3 n=1 Tax=Drosophila teissieri TaxID=7243 RepID=UPI001CBA4FF9|nr:uncharacterized protein LOC122618282 isoform X3 [Drosophila teissieri]